MPVMTGKRAFLELLKLEGVSVMFGNPGTSELPLMDALAVDDGIRYILAMQEGVAMAMADGYARASGGLGVVNVHVSPGLGNAMGMLNDAQKANSPVIVTAGQQAQGFASTEPNPYGDLTPIAEPMVKWSVEVRTVAELPRIIHRAAKVALAPPTGPVFVSLPTDIMNGEADIDLGRATRIAPLGRGDSAAIREAAAILANSERPLLIAGNAVSQSNAVSELVELAEVLGAPVHLEGESSANDFPTTHPLYAGQLPRAAAVIRKTLDQHDVLFSIGGDIFTLSLPPEIEPVPNDLKIIHLDTDPWQIGKNYHASPAILGDPKGTLPEITKAVRAAMSPAQTKKAAERMAVHKARLEAARAELRQRATLLAAKEPMMPLAVMQIVGDVLPENAIVIDEAISSAAGLREFLKCTRPDSYHGVRGGGIGWGLPGSVGVKLANPDRPVVALIGDGSAMYSTPALWTAARYNLGIVFVIFANRSYNILKQRLIGMRGFAAQTNNYVGMDLGNPNIDFAGLGRALGVESHNIRTLAAFKDRLAAAIAANKPVLIELEIANS